MTNVATPFPAGSLVWLPWRRVCYLTRVEDVRQGEDDAVKLLNSGLGLSECAPLRSAAARRTHQILVWIIILQQKLLVHVHGEPLTKDKWVTVYQNGSSAVGTPPLRLLQVLPNALTGVGALPAVGNHVRLLVMDQELIERIASRRRDDSNDVEVPALVGIVVKVLPARDASLVDVVYPTDLVTQTPDEAQWQRVQIGNGYVSFVPCV